MPKLKELYAQFFQIASQNFFGIRAAARELGVYPNTVHVQVKRNQIAYLKLNDKRFLIPDWVLEKERQRLKTKQKNPDVYAITLTDNKGNQTTVFNAEQAIEIAKQLKTCKIEVQKLDPAVTLKRGLIGEIIEDENYSLIGNYDLQEIGKVIFSLIHKLSNESLSGFLTSETFLACKAYALENDWEKVFQLVK